VLLEQGITEAAAAVADLQHMVTQAPLVPADLPLATLVVVVVEEGGSPSLREVALQVQVEQVPMALSLSSMLDSQ